VLRKIQEDSKVPVRLYKEALDVRQQGHVCAQGLLNNFRLPTLAAFMGAEELLNRPAYGPKKNKVHSLEYHTTRNPEIYTGHLILLG
jgi:hypothetical protein